MADQKKKMNLTQLTFIVTVNMMGSGIIMLPSNMAKVGAISLLSWIVTAVGSLALAWGFAQAGLFNQRPGGLAAYAKTHMQGRLLPDFLPLLHLAGDRERRGREFRARLRVGVRAGDHVDAGDHVRRGHRAALDHDVRQLRRPEADRPHRRPHRLGRHPAVGFISIAAGSGSAARRSRQPGTRRDQPERRRGVEHLAHAVAFLGLESAAQNSNAVENPKRDVPLACMLGTAGAAVIYILSTTVIQGIVPNADLAASNGPFGLAFARMFNPAVGSVVMSSRCSRASLAARLAVHAGQTGKAAADDGMFPTVFSQENRLGAPIAGMVIMGVVQSLMALMTISPNLNEQFSALVNLAS